jgi:hypothetical protein
MKRGGDNPAVGTAVCCKMISQSRLRILSGDDIIEVTVRCVVFRGLHGDVAPDNPGYDVARSMATLDIGSRW